MSISLALLNCKSHRPFPLPHKSWKYYQEWDDTLFLHYKIPQDILWELLPPGLLLDTYQGEAWLSVVAFRVSNMRLKYLPPVPYASEFDEINFRTYVIKDGIPGIYFITIETGKLLTALMAKGFIGLDYQKAKIKHRHNRYNLSKSVDDSRMHVKYLSLQTLPEKTNLDKWLTERYCAYTVIHKKMYRFNIHHKPWPLKKIKLRRIEIQYNKGRLQLLNTKHDLQHFAQQQKVLLWGRQKCS